MEWVYSYNPGARTGQYQGSWNQNVRPFWILLQQEMRGVGGSGDSWNSVTYKRHDDDTRLMASFKGKLLLEYLHSGF